MGTIAANDRMTPTYAASVGQTDFPVDFPPLKYFGVYAGLYATKTVGEVVTTLSVGTHFDVVNVSADPPGFTARLHMGAGAGETYQFYGKFPAGRSVAWSGAAFNTATAEADMAERTIQIQELRRDLDLALAGGGLGGGGGPGGGVAGVSSVNARDGDVILTASDVATGFNAAVRAGLVAGSGISFATVGDQLVITNSGGGGGGGVAGVSSVNGRTGAVGLTASDVTTGLGAAVFGVLAAGSGIGLGISGGLVTISNTGGGVTSVNTRVGAVTLTAADITTGLGPAVFATLVQGANVTLTNSGGATTISASLPGGGASSSSYVGSTVGGYAVSTIALPASCSAGDLAILYMAAGSNFLPTPPSGWSTAAATTVTAALSVTVAFRVLTAADITAGAVTLNTGVAYTPTLLVYRGPTTLSLATDLAATAATIAVPGFPKSTANIGTLALFFQNNPGGSTPTPPASPFTSRFNATITSVGLIAASDAIGASVYVDNATVSWVHSLGFTAAGFTLELRNDGVSSVAGVVTVNGRNGGVTLTASDVTTGLGAAVFGKLVAGTGIGLSLSGDNITVSATGGGGGGGVSSVNTRVGAVTLSASDVTTGLGAAVFGKLAAGAGIGLSLSGDTITFTASGSLAYSYIPAWENGITTGTVAATNVANLNALITTQSAAGGGDIWFNAPGPYQVDGTIHLKSNVSIYMASGAFFSWVGAAGGTIFDTPSTSVLTGGHYDLFVNEGGAFTGTVLRMHSAYRNTWNLVGFGTETAAGTFIHISADSSGAGSFSDANVAFNKVRAIHMGTCGTFLLTDGLAPGSGLGGNQQVVTLNNFEDLQAVACLSRGIKLENWTDSNEFSGQTRLNMTGANSIGFRQNEAGSGTPSVYNNHFSHLAVDTFGTGLNRKGVVLGISKGTTCDQFFQNPPAEAGAFDGSAATSYQFRLLVGDATYPGGGVAIDSIYIHQKAVSAGL